MRALVTLGRSALWWWFLLLVLTVVYPVPADDFRLYQRRVSAGETGEVLVNVWQVGTNQFYFLRLPGWQVQGDESSIALTMRSPDQGATIVWRLINDVTGATNALAITNDFRSTIQERFPDGEILTEFECYVAGGRGMAWDIRRLIPLKAVLQTRVLRVLQPTGLMEFELTTMLQKFPEHEVTFRALLSSIRIEPASKEK